MSEVKILVSPAEVVEYLFAKKEVARVRVLEFLDQPAIVVKIKLKLLVRLRCILSGDYRDKTLQEMQMDLNKRIVEEIPIHLIFVV